MSKWPTGPWSPYMKKAAALLSTIAAIATALAAILGAFSGGPNPPPVATSHTADGKKITVPKPAVDAVDKTDAGNHQALNDEQPGKPGVQLEPAPAVKKLDDKAASSAAPRISGPVPLAAAHQAGCTTRSNSNNFSYRTGIKPSLIVPHLTVARNYPGWTDINGVWLFLNRAATQASANYIVDNEAHCILAVSESLKAWAQAGFNSATACSIEVQNTGNETTYVGRVNGAGERQLARIIGDCSKRWHIPLRRGAVSGCHVTRAGVVDHYHLGSCGGGHVDIHNFGLNCGNAGPGADTWRCVDRLIAVAKAGSKPPPSAHANALCREYEHYQREVRAHTFPEKNRARSNAVRAVLVKYGYRCSASGRAIRK